MTDVTNTPPEQEPARVSAGQPAGLNLPAGFQFGFSAQQTLYQGPFPPPEVIERYEQLMPGTFNRIVSMAEENQRAQIDLNQQGLDATKDDMRRGQFLGFTVAMAGVAGAIFFGAFHQPLLAGAFLALPLMGVATALINSAKERPTRSTPDAE